jgi:hypothetical protein
VQQTNPFTFDKHQFNLAKSTGKVVDVDLVEEAVPDEIEMTERRGARKKARASTTRNRRGTASTQHQASRPLAIKARRCDSVASSAASARVRSSHNPDLSSITLRVWLDGFPRGSCPTTLEACITNDELINFINKAWGWCFDGKVFSFATASFPWLTADANILIRPGLEDSFRKMVVEIHNAPVWEEKGDEGTCEVKIMVYLQDANDQG